jgi:starch synthase
MVSCIIKRSSSTHFQRNLLPCKQKTPDDHYTDGMPEKLPILMAAAECRGVAKVGGLADVVFDLSARLQAEGHQVTVLLPLYSETSLAKTGSEVLTEFTVMFGGTMVTARLHRATINGLEVHLIDAPAFRGEDGSVYIDSGTRGHGPFEDDARRFAFFSAAVWELVKTYAPFQGIRILHCHDWHTALIPLFVRLDGLEDRYSTVFTIHNLDYQGTRPWDDDYAPLASWRQWFPERWKMLKKAKKLYETATDPAAKNCFNPMRCGIRASDAVNTVSPTYAAEITRPDNAAANFLGGRGLENDLALRQKEGRLWGIINGLDYEAFDPEKLTPPFSSATSQLLEVRRRHRDALWSDLPRAIAELEAKHGKKFGNVTRVREHLPEFLETARALPLTVCVTRAVRQKLGLFVEDLEPGVPLPRAFLHRGSALLVIGTGELEAQLEPLNDEPAALFIQCFDADFATRLYAAGELFLMPSDFEPCGISQLMAMRYGCLPLVHDRGGLHDTVRHGKTGFVFQGATRQAAKKAFLETVSRAVAAMNGIGYQDLVRHAMEQRFEWTGSVRKYEEIYVAVGKTVR